MATHESGPVSATVEMSGPEFAQLLREVKAFDATLSRNLRKNLRGAAAGGVAAVQQRLRGGSYKRDVGLREGLARGTRASISGAGKKAGVTITTTARFLPANRQAMVRAFNKPSFRHPTFGDRSEFVTETGRPYFGSVLYPRLPSMRAGINDAALDALRTIHAGEVHR